MATKTLVHLLRHGEVHNPDGILYGRLAGYHLSERGHEMARAVADHLVAGQADIVHLVASPLERAQQTAAPISRAFDLPIHTDERVIEAANHFEGQTVGAGPRAFLSPRHWWYLRNPFAPSWGEPYSRQVTRMIDAVKDAREHARGHEAVIVSHQLPVWLTRCKAERRRLWHDPRSRECTLASITSLVFEDDDLVDVVYSEPAAHLLAGANPVAGA